MGYYVKNRVLPGPDTHVVVPSGGSDVRPPAPATGSFRFNTDLGGLEFFDGTAFSTVARVGSVDITVDSFTGDSSTLTFSLSTSADSATSVLVFVGSVYQQPTTVYSITGGGNDITFTEAVPDGLSINVIHGFASTEVST